MKEKNIVPTKNVQVMSSAEALISQAIGANVPIETLERLVALRDKDRVERAKQVFVEAMANFQSACPVIEKKKKVMNKDGQTVRYQYAPLDVIVEQIKKHLAANGLSYTWDVKNDPGFMTAVATITHSQGHSTTSEFKVPIDTEGYMTAPQKYASALTFAKRYSLCNALGISTGDEDTDATDVNKEPNAKSPKAKIVFLLRTLKQESKDKKEIEEAVKKMTQLDLVEGNYNEIVTRLEVLVNEQNDNQNGKV